MGFSPVTVTRRSFLELSVGIVATLTASAFPSDARSRSQSETTGVLYGRTGTTGIAPGTPSAPSRGDVVLLDGSVVEAANAASQLILAGKSVLISADGCGGWTVLYAELCAQT
jgi:hypothetical protein